MAERKNQLLRKVKAEFIELSGEEEAQRIEELKDKWERDYNSGVSHAMEEGMRQGMKEGLEQGLEQGLQDLIETYQDDMQLSYDEAVAKLQKKRKLDKSEAERIVKKFWN